MNYLKLAAAVTIVVALLAVPTTLAGTKSVAAGTSDLQYFGGPVLHSTKTYAIFWLPTGYHYVPTGSGAGTTAESDPSYEAALSSFLGHVGGTSYYNLLTQYFQGTPPQDITNASTFVDSWLDNHALTAFQRDSRGNCLPDPAIPEGTSQGNPLRVSDITCEVEYAIQTNNRGWTSNPDAVFFVFTPEHVYTQNGSDIVGGGSCGFHGWGGPNPANRTYTFAVVGSPSTNPGTCQTHIPGATGVNGFPNNAPVSGAATSWTAHELFEAVTDTGLEGWKVPNVAPDLSEMADTCQNQGGTDSSYPDNLNGQLFSVPEMWSNQGHRCTLQLPSAAGGRGSWSVTLSADRTTLPVGASATLTATANKSVHGNTTIQILDQTDNNAPVPTTCTATICTGRVATDSAFTISYIAEIVTADGTVLNQVVPQVQVTWVSRPVVASISPNSGPPAGGTFVTITGTGFTGASSVMFGSAAATSYTVDSGTQITAISPAEVQGTVDVTVATPGGTSALSSSDQFTFNAASAWTVFPPPPGLTGYPHLLGLAAVSASDIWAVGFQTIAPTFIDQTLIEHWDGTSWSAVPSPNVGPGSDILDAVAGTSSTNAWAVGYSCDASCDPGSTRSLVEHWNGTSWSVVTDATDTNQSNRLSSIVAVSANDVWAVGIDTPAIFDSQTLIEQWNGSQWQIVPSPNGPGYCGLNSIASLSASDMWAVGGCDGDVDGTLTEHWDGSSWSVTSSPNTTTNGVNQLNGVSGSSSNDVWAVGFGAGPLTEHWDGSSWTVVPDPVTSTGNPVELQSVVSLAPNDAWTVDTGSGVIQQWDGTQWQEVAPPAGDGGLWAITAVSGHIWVAGDGIIARY